MLIGVDVPREGSGLGLGACIVGEEPIHHRDRPFVMANHRLEEHSVEGSASRGLQTIHFLTRRALDALERIPARLDTPLLFPAPKGGYIGLDTWRTREWYPAIEAAGIVRRGPYHLRHTFATEALAAGVSIFELARLMGTSVAMIDRTYGHLARDSEAAIRDRLDARVGRADVDLASEPVGG